MDQDYAFLWDKEARGGYGFIEAVHCRILSKTTLRVKIAALRRDGTEVVRYVKPEKLRRRESK